MMADERHAYDQLLEVLETAPHAHRSYPEEGTRAETMLQRAIRLVVRAEEYGDPEPYPAGLRLDVWVPVKDGWIFAFRMDKDIPYEVRFTDYDERLDLVNSWQIRHWEV